MKIIILFIFLGLFLPFPSHAQSLTSGVWKAKISFNLNGLPLPPSEEQDCILPNEVKDVRASIEKNLKKKKCELTKWVVKGKKVEASLTCNSDELEATGNLKGEFSKKSYHLKGEASGTIKNILPATATIDIQGNWISACEKK
jgi:hypothetical protein